MLICKIYNTQNYNTEHTCKAIGMEVVIDHKIWLFENRNFIEY